MNHDKRNIIPPKNNIMLRAMLITVQRTRHAVRAVARRESETAFNSLKPWGETAFYSLAETE